MQESRVFGRRVSSSTASQKSRAEPPIDPREIASVAVPIPPIEDAPMQPPAPQPLKQELEEWNAARKRHKRSFREPWRTVSIVAGLAFAATSWMVPGAVANATEVALGVLTAGSIYAGWRGRNPPAAAETRTFDPNS